VRPGTIYGAGSGGLFAALERAVSAAPVLPDFGARARLHLVHASDLIRVVETLLVRDAAHEAPPAPAILPVAHPESVRFREILERIARARGTRARFVPVPPPLALAGLRTLEALSLRPPFRSDSLIGMLHGNPTPGLMDEVLGVPLRPFTPEALRA
jgi:nucleoside-diphosphate-sugar epimerase